MKCRHIEHDGTTFKFQPPTPTLNATMHSVTDRSTDRQTTAWCQ